MAVAVPILLLMFTAESCTGLFHAHALFESRGGPPPHHVACPLQETKELLDMLLVQQPYGAHLPTADENLLELRGILQCNGEDGESLTRRQ